MKISMRYTYVDSPVGRLLLYGGNCPEGLVFPSGRYALDPDPFRDAGEQFLLEKEQSHV